MSLTIDRALAEEKYSRGYNKLRHKNKEIMKSRVSVALEKGEL